MSNAFVHIIVSLMLSYLHMIRVTILLLLPYYYYYSQKYW